MKHGKNRRLRGFTLIEIVVALAVVGILAAVAAPSLIGYVREGERINRDSIARTLYLAAQNQLTEKRITKQLKNEYTSFYANTSQNNVYNELLDENWATTSEPDENKEYVRYISKRKGVTNPNDPVIRLLSPVVKDQLVLNDAILIEFNIKTGIVLSVFYSDVADNLGYGEAYGDGNVTGPRDGGFTSEFIGYYGVGSTGTIIDMQTANITIYDSYSDSAPSLYPDNKNLLYATVLIPKTAKNPVLKINGAAVAEADIKKEQIPELADDPDYTGFYWILDAFGDGLHSVSIASGYGWGGNIKITLADDNGLYAESNELNPYYFDNKGTVKSARHLNNVRLNSGSTFTQGDDIDLSVKANFVPIPSLSGSYNGNGYAISNLTVDTSADNAGLFGSVSDTGTVDALTLINPSVEGTTNTGTVCGVLEANGTVKGAYVAYTDDSKRVTGTGNVGGLAGINNGSLLDSTFISPAAAVHITGNAETTGGLVGVNTGTMAQNQFLALAPGQGTGTIRPIAGTDSGAATSQYYLCGTAIRPEPAQLGSEDYNTEGSNAGEPAGTNTMWIRFAAGGLKLTASAGSLDPDNTVYPYAYYKTGTAEWPNWPVAGESKQSTGLVYYELYEDGTWGYDVSSHRSGNPIQNTKLVLNDGYSAEMSFIRTGFYELTIGTRTFKIETGGSESNAVWIVTENGGAPLGWAYHSFISTDPSNDGETMCRLYIPNAVLEGAADPGGRTAVKLKTDISKLIDESFISLFAPDRGIRSPRHIDNIDRVGSTSVYSQQLDVDFALYCRELTGGPAPAADAGTKLSFSGAVVTGTRSGTYDGNGKGIYNLTITGSADGAGLFAANNGIIRNVTMYDANISGGNNAGGIAAVNGAGGIIENCVLASDMPTATCTITGTSNVGGITGVNGGTVTGCKVIAVDAGGVSAINAGGIAGNNSGIITRSYISSVNGNYNAVSGANNVGGIAGQNNGGSIDICYADFTRVGGSAGSVNVGGIAGYMDGGTVRDVFYNYGNSNPQASNWIVSITGQTETTGGLIGFINAGTLSNAYSDAYFSASAENVIYGGRNGTANFDNIMYLHVNGYNGTVTAYGIQPKTVSELRAAAAVTALNTGGTGVWALGSGCDDSLNGSYTYPCLTGLEEPRYWPVPGAVKLNFMYYEIYPGNNTKTGGNYGLWGGDSDDRLDYTQKVLQDGYALIGENITFNGNSTAYAVYGITDTTAFATKQHMTADTVSALGNLSCVIFDIDVLAKFYADNNYSAILPLRVQIGQGNSDKADYFDGYINPFFAKSVYGRHDIDTQLAKNPDYFTTAHRYLIRTPRHLNNIKTDESTLKGRFTQEIDIDFSSLNTANGYWNTKKVSNQSTNQSARTSIDISNSVVPGTFTGAYTALSPYDKKIKAIKNLTINNQNGDNIGIFRQTGGGAAIENLRLLNNSITGRNNIAGLTVSNNGGTIRSITAEDITLTAPNGSASGLTGQNTGTISDCSVKNTTVTGGGGAYGIAVTNGGTISGITVENLTVTAQNGARSGITGESTGTIDTVTMTNVTVTGGGNDPAAGIAIKQEGGLIQNIICNDLTVYSQNGSGAGIACESTGTIENCKIDVFTITGMSYTGGIAGNSTGSIKNTTVQNGMVIGTSGSCAGGIAGSSKIIADCLVTNVDITGVNNLGGVAGEVTGTGALIARTGVIYSTVTSEGGKNVGGIAGVNGGVVEDVFFLSVAKDADGEAAMPVKGNTAGGIAGQNDNIVRHAFCLAPAPQSTNNGKTTIYPIVGGGNPAEVITVSVDGVESPKETCFYLSGSRYSTNNGAEWVEEPYNRGPLTNLYEVGGGGRGLITEFLDKEWLNTLSGVMDDGDFFPSWRQPTPSEQYPYPLLNKIGVPDQWPVSSSPVRLDQVDEPDWEATLPTTNRAINVDFINGDFADAYLSTDGIVETVGSNGSRRVYIDSLSVYGWNTRPVNASDYTGNYSNSGIPRWRIFEFQEPVIRSGTDMYGQYAYTNYQGKANTALDVNNSIYRYAELNAEVQGTLYQISDTTPGTQFYYSFYHTTRLGGTAENNVTPVNNVYIDRMNFYLTGVSDTAQMAEDSKLTLIRPCWSPRTAASGNGIVNTNNSNNGDPLTLYNNPAVRYTVAYGNGTNVYGNNYEFNLEYYRKAYPDLPVGKDLPGNGRPYIYDVWISDYGYGITFWSTSNVTASSIGNSVKSINNLPQTLRNDAQNHVMGYWSISFGWKQYYGLYTVPEGQKRTEFAYQSRRNDAQNGNYLDGITFKSPGFLSIDKYARIDGKDVSFVQPNDTITIDIYVKNWGEVTTDGIEITDRLDPYDEYIEYIGNVKVSRVDAAGKETADITSGADVGFNNETQTLSVKPNIGLKTNEEIKISFDIKVRERVLTPATPGGDPSETLLYYFKNQAVVTYKETEFSGFNDMTRTYTDRVFPKRNASGPEPVQAFIDPVKLEKTVTDISGEDSPYTYEVKLIIANALDSAQGVTTVGLVSDVIPKGFVIVDMPQSQNYICTNEPDGSKRITVRNINLHTGQKVIELSYVIRYADEGYGVTYTSLASDYKYLFDLGSYDPLNVMLEFPKQMVGIPVRTGDDEFIFDVNSLEIPVSGADPSTVFNITDNDWLENKLAADNYDVTPEIILFDENGEKAKKNTSGFYEFRTDEYIATLLSTGELVFTPLKTEEGVYLPGTYELSYQIVLIARKPGSDSFDLSSPVTKITVTVENYIITELLELLDDALEDAGNLILAVQEMPELQELPEDDETLIAVTEAVQAVQEAMDAANILLTEESITVETLESALEKIITATQTLSELLNGIEEPDPEDPGTGDPDPEETDTEDPGTEDPDSEANLPVTPIVLTGLPIVKIGKRELIKVRKRGGKRAK